MLMSFGRAVALGFSTVGLVVVVSLAASCGDSDGGSDGTTGAGDGGIICNGGVLDAAGNCVAKCDPALCLPNNICVNNQCSLQCTAHAECPAGYDCIPSLQDGIEDPAAAQVNVCRLVPKTGFAGTPCPFGTECGDKLVCPSGESCGASLCGGQACTPHPEFCPADQPDCTIGLCPDAATLCFVPPCAAEECRPMRCTGIGEGDGDAICVYDHCKEDADCPGGFYCGIARDPHNICNTSKGAEQPCVDPSTFTAAGQTFQEGPISLLKNSCLPRPMCAPCASDLDCPGASQVCRDLGGGDMRCTETCYEGNTSCRPDFACDTTAQLCLPETGSCIGGGGFCEPCLNDLDCAGGGPTMVCRTDILLDGQKACLDSALPTECTVDTECPEAPSGLQGECLDEAEFVSPGNSAYHKCFFPYLPTPPGLYTCWP